MTFTHLFPKEASPSIDADVPAKNADIDQPLHHLCFVHTILKWPASYSGPENLLVRTGLKLIFYFQILCHVT